jgi:hypothetical protein
MNLSLQNFMEQVDSAIALRGEAYFKNGAVVSIKERGPGEFVALVRGTEEYLTIVTVDGDDVLEASCSCPYSREQICKHVVAVLWELKDHEHGTISETIRTPTDSIDQKIESLPREALVELIQKARKGNSVERILKTAYADEQEWEDIRYVKSIVRESVDRASNRYGGISYSDTLDAVDGARSILDYAEEFKPLRPRAAAICCMAVIEVLSPTLMHADDSDGDINGTISEAFELLTQIAVRTRETDEHHLREEILTYALNEWSKKKYKGWDCPHMFLEIVSDLAVTSHEEQEAAKAFDRYAFPPHRDEKTVFADESYYRFQREHALELNLQMITRLHPERIDTFLHEHIEFYSMRKKAIERALLYGNTEQAKILARDGITQAEGDHYLGHVSRFRDTLMECAEREHDNESAYTIAMQQFFDSHTEPFTYFRAAKRYAGDSWQKHLSTVIATLKQERGKYADVYKLANLYVEEKLWGDLLYLVEKNSGLIETHATRLEKRFPSEIASLYAHVLEKESDLALGRSAYQAQCDRLRKIRELGHPEITERIIADWREKYPRRKTLMKELDLL